MEDVLAERKVGQARKESDAKIRLSDAKSSAIEQEADKKYADDLDEYRLGKDQRAEEIRAEEMLEHYEKANRGNSLGNVRKLREGLFGMLGGDMAKLYKAKEARLSDDPKQTEKRVNGVIDKVLGPDGFGIEEIEYLPDGGVRARVNGVEGTGSREEFGQKILASLNPKYNRPVPKDTKSGGGKGAKSDGGMDAKTYLDYMQKGSKENRERANEAATKYDADGNAIGIDEVKAQKLYETYMADYTANAARFFAGGGNTGWFDTKVKKEVDESLKRTPGDKPETYVGLASYIMNHDWRGEGSLASIEKGWPRGTAKKAVRLVKQIKGNDYFAPKAEPSSGVSLKTKTGTQFAPGVQEAARDGFYRREQLKLRYRND
ncbi:MAG: hypothetical protein GY841_16075 [FCB group bacterium]|nr:hypothetical protein [FCB group bacterium]